MGEKNGKVVTSIYQTHFCPTLIQRKISLFIVSAQLVYLSNYLLPVSGCSTGSIHSQQSLNNYNRYTLSSNLQLTIGKTVDSACTQLWKLCLCKVCVLHLCISKRLPGKHNCRYKLCYLIFSLKSHSLLFYQKGSVLGLHFFQGSPRITKNSI